MSELPKRARVYLCLIFAITVVAIVMSVLARPDWLVVVVLAGLTIVLERSSPGVASRDRISIGLVMTMPTALAAGALDGVAAAVLVGAAGVVHSGHLPLYKRLFNGAQFALAAGAAAAALRSLPGFGPDSGVVELIGAFAVGSIVYCLMNAALLTVALWLAAGARPLAVLTGTIGHTAAAYLGYGLLGLALAEVWGAAGALAATLVLVPLLAARWAFAQYAHEQQAYEATIRTLVKAVETKDAYTRGHSERVSRASVMIARVLGLKEDRVQALSYAGILHDVGKLMVPTSVLQKSGALTQREFEDIKLHPIRGQTMLADIEFLDEARLGILHHHERMDGRGYPHGLAGSDIPEFARIIAVADAFDSMTSTRSYRGARTVAEAVYELETCRGTQFDPEMVDALISALEREPWRSPDQEPIQPVATVEATRDTTPDHDDPAFAPYLPGGRTR